MKKLTAFNFITLNGYLNSPDGDIGWHRHGPEENQFAKEGASSGNTLLFGRKTYEMMASYWPGPMALQNDPVLAGYMNNADKIVFSRTLSKAEWKNTRVIGGNIVQEIKRLKETPGHNLTLLGSGSILSLFTESGLIDEYQIMIDPVAIGSGIPIFREISQALNLKLISVKTFSSGVVLLNYKA